MYTESEFMDMSIASRMMRINEEVAKLSMWALISIAKLNFFVLLPLFKIITKLNKKSDEELIKQAEEEEWNQVDKETSSEKKHIPVENAGGR